MTAANGASWGNSSRAWVLGRDWAGLTGPVCGHLTPTPQLSTAFLGPFGLLGFLILRARARGSGFYSRHQPQTCDQGRPHGPSLIGCSVPVGYTRPRMRLRFVPHTGHLALAIRVPLS